MQNEEIRAREKASEILACDSQIKTWENKRKDAVAWLVERGYTGEEVLTVGGEFKVSLSTGMQRVLDADKARDSLGHIYNVVLERKRARVTLSLSDLNGLADLDAVSEMKPATVKATVRRV